MTEITSRFNPHAKALHPCASCPPPSVLASLTQSSSIPPY